MKRSEPLKRTVPLRSNPNKPLRSDPQKTREWRQRTSKALPLFSGKRKAQRRERDAFREFVLKHRSICEARLRWCCTYQATEVNELQRGPGREDCWLNYDKVTSLCHSCHAFITLNPDWALHHGHQVQHEGIVTEHTWTMARSLRQVQMQLPCGAHCAEDHREAA